MRETIVRYIQNVKRQKREIEIAKRRESKKEEEE